MICDVHVDGLAVLRPVSVSVDPLPDRYHPNGGPAVSERGHQEQSRDRVPDLFRCPGPVPQVGCHAVPQVHKLLLELVVLQELLQKRECRSRTGLQMPVADLVLPGYDTRLLSVARFFLPYGHKGSSAPAKDDSSSEMILLVLKQHPYR